MLSMITSSILALLYIGAASAAKPQASKGDVCYASIWNPKAKGVFSDPKNWAADKAPNANTIAVVSGGGKVSVKKKVYTVELHVDGGDITVVEGAGLFVQGTLDCIGDKCDDKKAIQLFD